MGVNAIEGHVGDHYATAQLKENRNRLLTLLGNDFDEFSRNASVPPQIAFDRSPMPPASLAQLPLVYPV